MLYHFVEIYLLCSYLILINILVLFFMIFEIMKNLFILRKYRLHRCIYSHGTDEIEVS